MAAQIQEFRFNGNPWRIDWLGQIIYPGSDQNEPRITVHLSELTADYSDPLSNNSLAQPFRHEVVAINIGLITLLKIGSVWIDGIHVPPPKAPDQEPFSITADQISLVRFDDEVAIGGTKQMLLPSHRYRVGVNAFRNVAASWLGVVYNPTAKLKILVIPSTVLFQKCVATSPKAVRRLIYGEIDKIADPSSDFLRDDPSTYVIDLFKDFRESEATAIANLKADPIAKREYQRFRNALMVDSVNYDRGTSSHTSPPHMKLGLPFSNPTHILATGKYLNFSIDTEGGTKNEWGFLVTEIASLTTRLVFDQLVICRKNDASKGKNATDEDLPPSWGGSATIDPTDIGDPTPVTSADVPARSLDQYALESSGGFKAEDLQVIKNEKEVQKYRAAPRASAEDAESNGTVTTGTPQAGSKGATELDIINIQVPKIPITLEHFFETLALLRKKGYPFETIAVSTNYRQRERDSEIVNFLPRRIRDVRSWHLSSDYTNAPPRAYVVAELLLGGSWRYLVELQRKGDAALALQYIQAHSGERIAPSKIGQFLIDVAKENGWGAKEHYRGWICVPIRHSPSKGVTAFAEKIIKNL